eukprot:661634-Hanusia_phi.AAC.1
MPTHDHKNGARADLWLPGVTRTGRRAEALRDSWLIGSLAFNTKPQLADRTLCLPIPTSGALPRPGNLTLWSEVNLDAGRAQGSRFATIVAPTLCRILQG